MQGMKEYCPTMSDTIADKQHLDANAINVCLYAKAMNILTCSARYNDMSIPINHRIIGKYADLETQATKFIKRNASLCESTREKMRD